MALIMLRSPQGEFRRSVRNSKTGKVSHVLVFLAGQPIDLRGDDLVAVADDIGNALVEVKCDNDGKRPKPKTVPAPPAESPPAAKKTTIPSMPAKPVKAQ